MLCGLFFLTCGSLGVPQYLSTTIMWRHEGGLFLIKGPFVGPWGPLTYLRTRHKSGFLWLMPSHTKIQHNGHECCADKHHSSFLQKVSLFWNPFYIPITCTLHLMCHQGKIQNDSQRTVVFMPSHVIPRDVCWRRLAQLCSHHCGWEGLEFALV